MNYPDLVLGADGVQRCGWVGQDEQYRGYHDNEWGIPLHGDRELFEKLCLEGFQAGLSWITILRKRENFRAAFAGFEIATVSRFTEKDIARLMEDAGIVRNRAKILATIRNAQITRELITEKPGSLDRLIWAHAAPGSQKRYPSLAEVPAITAEASTLSRVLKKLGYRFVGPTTVYALMQAVGIVDDHILGCWRAETTKAHTVLEK